MGSSEITSQGTGPKARWQFPFGRGEGTNLGTENLVTKFREERKQETWCTVIPESQPPPQRSHGMLRQPELASGPAPHPAAAGPPPPSQPGAAPECK